MSCEGSSDDLNAPLLQTEKLTRRYGNFVAVSEVSLVVPRGQVKALIGPNGAGKTSLFNMLSGQIAPSGGRVLYKGENITGLPPNILARRGIGRSFQISSVFPKLSVLENVEIAVQAQNDPGLHFFSAASRLTESRQKATDILSLVGLSHFLPQHAGTLSHGDQRRLELGIVLAGNPELILLDEPTAGMSGADTMEFAHLLAQIRSGKTILFVEHNIDFVMQTAQRIVVMERGRLLFEGILPTRSGRARKSAARTWVLCMADDRNALLEVRKVSCSYGQSAVLHDISLSVAENSIVSVIGRNGAGKSSLFRTITGLLRPLSGEIIYAGRNICGLRANRIARMGISLVPEDRRIHRSLTVAENIILGAHGKREALERTLTLFPSLAEHFHKFGDQLSGGEQQMVAIARALVSDPRMVLIDEPLEGLAPLINGRIRAALEGLRGKITVIIIEQNIRWLLGVADYHYVMNQGRIVYGGTSADIKSDPEVLDRHIGVQA